MTTAFVLGGGGLLGACEVGMLRALADAGITPDLVVGTSVGAINGAFVAADPAGSAARLTELWGSEAVEEAFSENIWGRAVRLARSGTHLHAIEPLQQMLGKMLPAADFTDLALPFQCVAASIEQASARWFSSGPLVPAILASCAVPGLLPPVPIGDEHCFDGGLVDSIPVGRAVTLGATTVYVLQVGRIESPLRVPRQALGGRAGRVRDRQAAPVPRGGGGPARRGRGAPAADRRQRQGAGPVAASLPGQGRGRREHRARPRGVRALPGRARPGLTGSRRWYRQDSSAGWCSRRWPW